MCKLNLKQLQEPIKQREYKKSLHARHIGPFCLKQTSPCWLPCLDNGKINSSPRATQAAGCNKTHEENFCTRIFLPKCMFTKPWKLAAHAWLTTTLTILANCKLHSCVNRHLNSTAHQKNFFFSLCSKCKFFLRWHNIKPCGTFSSFCDLFK